MTGLILQSIGGFFYVEAADGVYECRGRGMLRYQGVTPLAGDRVEWVPGENRTGTVTDVLPRKNSLIRPPVANLDCLVTVISTADPTPSLSVVDRMIAVAEHKGIEPVPVFSKTDLEDPRPLEELYRGAGFTVFTVCADRPESVEPLREYLRARVCAFAGNSGVGKSTLLNLLDPSLSLAVGQTSKKLGRGRHTTRSAQLYPQPGGGYIADTPGFSSLDAQRLERIPKEELAGCFREFAPFLGHCRFVSCSHTGEKGCAVCQAVQNGQIAPSRHASYVAMYQEVKDWKEWQDK